LKGCRSRNFRVEGEELVTFEKLYRVMTGMSLAKLLEIDAFFLNEDRHTNNIALLYNARSGEYRLCPFFDMGLSLFADTFDSFPLSDKFETKK